MCRMNVIHCFTLEDLVGELCRSEPVGAGVVRLERIVRSQPTGTQGTANREIAIAVRALALGDLFSFWLSVGRVQTLYGKPFGPGAEFLATEFEDLADRLVEGIAGYLSSEGLSVRPGLIELWGADPVSGDWLGGLDEFEAEKKRIGAELEAQGGRL